MRTIIFFSSDARELYKADVYNALVLPKNFVIHFRYQQKHINPDLKELSFKNADGMLFFLTGNSLTKPNEKKNAYSIRRVKILESDISDTTGLVHFYLQLGNFIDYSFNEEITNPQYFVTIADVSGEDDNWDGVIDRVKAYFESKVLIHINKVVDKANKPIIPQFDKLSKQSYYDFNDEKNYAIDYSFYDCLEGKGKLVFRELKGILDINSSQKIVTGAVKDDRRIKILTHTLERKKASTVISVSQEECENNYPIEIPVTVSKTTGKTLIFALLSTLAIVGIGSINFIFRVLQIDKLCFWMLLLILLGFIFITFFSSACLYGFFNKK